MIGPARHLNRLGWQSRAGRTNAAEVQALVSGDVPMEGWLAEDVERFAPMFPMDRDDYLAFLAAIQENYSFRGLASLAGALLGVDYARCLNDTYLVASETSPVSAHALAEMRARVLERGWVPDSDG